jgi:hypothetical protein
MAREIYPMAWKAYGVPRNEASLILLAMACIAPLQAASFEFRFRQMGKMSGESAATYEELIYDLSRANDVVCTINW